jgi:DNA-binding transcriptional MocR family regulator
MSRTTPLYLQVAGRIEEMVASGVYEPGERLPSIRELHAQFHVSINTAREVYRVLEARGVVVARNQSGHYVRTGPQLWAVCDGCQMDFPEVADAAPRPVTPDELTRQVLSEGAQPGWVNLATAEPPAMLLPTRRLAELTARELRRDPTSAVSYTLTPGPMVLRQEIAKRIFRGGVQAHAESVLVTAGCLEAVFIALMTVCSPGDAVIIESPGFYLFYQLLQRLQLRAIEVPCRPGTGVEPEAIEFVLNEYAASSSGTRVAAALLIGNFSNPMGSLMPEENKRAIAALLDRYGVVLIEDDMYGEMSWDVERPPSICAVANPERAILCASFSKSIAPGYRIGWLHAGPELFGEAVHSKLVTSAAVSGPAAVGIAAFLEQGGYDRWLRAAHRHYRETVARVREVIDASFPAGTRSTRPAGGMVIWVVMPPAVDAVELYQRVRAQHIAFAPGPIFSLSTNYRNCLRVNATAWNEEIARAIAAIGAAACALAAA